jgi:N-acetyl-gamma-glutamyl-phosphate reductase
MSSAESTYPAIVLGGSGYVAGEFLRLIDAHPCFTLGAAVSSSQAGEPVAKTFAHLAPAYPDDLFVSIDAAIERLRSAPHWLVLSAAPHGASAQLVQQLLDAAAAAGVAITIVDASADFRFTDTAQWAKVYGHEHATPELIEQFTCAVPEQLAQIDTPHAAHPGCFATTMLLAIVPLAAAGLADEFQVSAVTGSTGAGRTPRETTHHPVRQSNMFAYQALKHRHDPEVRALAKAAARRDIDLKFVPHSGPFARGIHATIFARAKERVTSAQVTEALAEYYRGSRFVRVETEPPRVKDIVATNYSALHALADGDTIVVCSVLDNLLKGAAGGSIQWANRLLGLPEDMGLTAPAAGWL